MKVFVICGLIFAVLVNKSYSRPTGEDAVIVGQTNEADQNGYSYSYETSAGQQQFQSGYINSDGILVVNGSYTYIGDDGIVYTVSYTADENGYRVTGEHVPKGADGYLELLKSNDEEPPTFALPPAALLSLVGGP